MSTSRVAQASTSKRTAPTYFAEVQARAPAAQLVGAGGLRSPADLQAAEAEGAAGWLVASALHDLQLPPVAGCAGR